MKAEVLWRSGKMMMNATLRRCGQPSRELHTGDTAGDCPVVLSRKFILCLWGDEVIMQLYNVMSRNVGYIFETLMNDKVDQYIILIGMVHECGILYTAHKSLLLI